MNKPSIGEEIRKNMEGAKAKPKEPRKISKDDICLSEKVEKEVTKIIDFLNDPSVYGEEMGYTGVMFYGPPGTGKTLSALYIVNETGANFYTIETLPMKGGEEVIRQVFEAARESARETKKSSIIFFDELDKYFPKRSDVADVSDVRLVSQLLSEMDGLYTNEGVLVIGSTNRDDAIDPALRRPGRFDKEVEIGTPDEEARERILRIHAKKNHKFRVSDEDMKWAAAEAYGYTGGDLKGLMKEAFTEAKHAAIAPLKEKHKKDWKECTEWKKIKEAGIGVTKTYLQYALNHTFPSGLRGMYFKKPEKSFADIGGYGDVKQQLRDCVVDAIKHAEGYKEMHITSDGILLHGPAGTGKTVMAEAVARESGANLLFIRGPEVYHWLYGKSESIIRDIFRKARAAAPSIVVLDEIDSFVGARGMHTNIGDSITGQMLSQMGNMDGVYVIGTSNRFPKIDPALLRKGRMGTHVEMGLPDGGARKEIWNIYLAHIPSRYDISDIRSHMDDIIHVSDSLSGADIEGIVTAGIKRPLLKGVQPTYKTVEAELYKCKQSKVDK